MRNVILATLLILPQIVYAQDETARAGLSYTYGELRYVDVDERGGDGLLVGGSYRLNEEWFVFGEIRDLEFNPSIDQSDLEFGGGYIHSLDGSFDLVATASLLSVEIDTLFFDDDDTGIALSGGVRGFITPQLEVRGFVNHVNLDNNDTFLELAVDYFFSERLSAGASLEFAGDRDLITAGVRFHF